MGRETESFGRWDFPAPSAGHFPALYSDLHGWRRRRAALDRLIYWPTAAGQAPSPFSALAAQAQAAGYTPGAHKHKHPRPFFGYYFRILKRQGVAAPGGAFTYVRDSKMVRGFALWSADLHWRPSLTAMAYPAS